MRKINSKEKIYSAVIVGTGRIGAGFDSPDSEDILTYAHAFSSHRRIRLAAFVDIDVEHGQYESKRWGVPFYSDLAEMFTEVEPDIVVIASPDNTHARLIEEISRLSPKLIICEKPAVTTLSEAAHIKEQNFEKNVPIIVNFSRQFDPVVLKLREEILDGKYGAIISGNGTYTKGLIHNGLHLIDLARLFFGELISSNMHFRIQDTERYGPSIGGFATFERCPQFYIMIADARFYSIFEFEILTERARLKFFNSGRELKIESVIPSELFKGDHLLGEPDTKKTKILEALPYLVEHAIAVIDGIEKPRSTLSDALKTYSTAMALTNNFKK